MATCGSGITACWIVVAGLLCGMKSVPLYDVSALIATLPISQYGETCLANNLATLIITVCEFSQSGHAACDNEISNSLRLTVI